MATSSSTAAPDPAPEPTAEPSIEPAPGTPDAGVTDGVTAGPADAFNSFYQTWLASAGVVVQQGAAAQAEGNTAMQATTNSGITQLYTLCAAANARAVALLASCVRQPAPVPQPTPVAPS